MVAAIVLAAGFSRRMGFPKQLLPWENSTVIGVIVNKLVLAGIQPIVVVTGEAREQIAAVLAGQPVQVVLNPKFQEDSMVQSLQSGLACLPADVPAALVVLGDQPQMPVEVIRLLLESYTRTGSQLTVPSYRMRRGHPWLIDCSLWSEIMDMPAEHTLRSFINSHAGIIRYVETDMEAVILDLDTPEEYARFRPHSS